MPEAADAERPADSLHNPPGGPSTSHTPASPDPPSDPAPSKIAAPTQAIGGTNPSTAQPKRVKALQKQQRCTSSEPTADTGNKSSSSSSLTDIDWDSAADTDTSSVSSQEDCTVDSSNEEDSAAEQGRPYVVLAVKLKSGRVGSHAQLT